MKARYIPELKRLLTGKNLAVWMNESGLPRDEEEKLKVKWKEEAMVAKLEQDMKPKEPAKKPCGKCGQRANEQRDTDKKAETTLQSVAKTQSSSWRLSSIDGSSESDEGNVPGIPDSRTNTLPGTLAEQPRHRGLGSRLLSYLGDRLRGKRSEHEHER